MTGSLFDVAMIHVSQKSNCIYSKYTWYNLNSYDTKTYKRMKEVKRKLFLKNPANANGHKLNKLWTRMFVIQIKAFMYVSCIKIYKEIQDFHWKKTIPNAF